MRQACLLWLCLAVLALAAEAPRVTIKDIVFREDNYTNYVGSPDYDPYQVPTVRISSTLRNEGKQPLKKLKARLTWSSMDGQVLRKTEETLPDLPPGRDSLYFAPPLENPGKAYVQFQIDILDGNQVIATRNEHQ